MKRLTRFTYVVAFLFVLLPMGTGSLVSAAQIAYTVEDLGVLPGDINSFAAGINAQGDVVGWSSNRFGVSAFVFTDAAGLVELPDLAGMKFSYARDINDLGDVVGTSALSGEDDGRAVLWAQGSVTDLGTLGKGTHSGAWAINNNGEIVGSSHLFGGKGAERAFRTTPEGVMIDFMPEYNQAAALDINDKGQITGYRTLPDGSMHGFRWQDEVGEDIGVLSGFDQSCGWSINAAGWVVGSASNKETDRMLRSGPSSKPQDIGGKFPHSVALAINSKGSIVGYSGEKTGFALLYTPSVGVRDLNKMIDPLQGWFLDEATDINDAGQIVGYAHNGLGKIRHAVRLQPVLTVPN